MGWNQNLDPEDATLGLMQVPESGMITCPKGHELAAFKKKGDWNCDMCGRRSKEHKKKMQQRYRCAQCDYDLCEECVKSLRPEGATSESKKVETTPGPNDTSKDNSMLRRARRSLSRDRTEA